MLFRSYGEVEDYTVNITQSSSAPAYDSHNAEPISNEVVEPYVIYPNPTSTKLFVDLKGIEGDVSIRIYDLQGRLMKESSFRNLNAEIDVSDLANGIYIISIDEEKMPINKRFVKM